MKKNIAILGLVVVALAGCLPSEPVVVNTDKGSVTCDLYIRDFVMWDRAMSRPSSLPEEEANAICRSIDANK